MMDAFLAQSIEAAGCFGQVIKLLVDGVAFPSEDTKVYDVFSHEGDELGQVATADVGFAINFMRRRGRAVGKLEGMRGASHLPAFTFAWEGYLFTPKGQRL